jgi:predicted P-loop ATPase
MLNARMLLDSISPQYMACGGVSMAKLKVVRPNGQAKSQTEISNDSELELTFESRLVYSHKYGKKPLANGSIEFLNGMSTGWPGTWNTRLNKHVFLAAKSGWDLPEIEKLWREYAPNPNDTQDIATIKSAFTAAKKNPFSTIGHISEPWSHSLDLNKRGRPLSTLKNLMHVFNNLAHGDPFVVHDEFAVEDRWVKGMPWGDQSERAVSDPDCRRIKEYLTQQFNMEPDVGKILEAILIFADKNRIHPVRHFLNGLEWDGKKRAEKWLETYLGAAGPREYLKAVGLKTLVAMVARVFKPGIKFDHMPIWEGMQGIGKSSAARILSEPWFSDASLNIGDKDAVINMQGGWINELGELAAMNRSELNTLKEFLVRQDDKIRPPYGRLPVKYPRQNIFIGTTNNQNYLKDKTGNRRFWPVKVNGLKRADLTKDRDQLLAEALYRYKLGTTLYLNDEQERLARTEQGLRIEHDELQDVIADYLAKQSENFLEGFRMTKLMEGGGPCHHLRDDQATQNRIGAALRGLGYQSKSTWCSALKRNAHIWSKVSS